MKVLPAEKKEVLTYMKEHEDTMFPHSFSFSNSDGKQPEDRELFGDILSLLDELNLKSEDDDEPVPSDEKDDPQSTDAKRPNGSETPSDSSGDNGHPSNAVADSRWKCMTRCKKGVHTIYILVGLRLICIYFT